jgi:hypothetical protein
MSAHMAVEELKGWCVLGLLAAACGLPGQNGRSSLMRLVPEPAGVNCSSGGTAIHSGLDANGNGALEDSEVQSTAYTCNGATGGSGSPAPGALVRLESEPAGANCTNGGVVVYNGLDTDHDGTLESGEETSTMYVCNGASGSEGRPGARALVRLDPETAGANCEAGGTAVRSGVDTNGNGTLDTTEAASTSYICNGTTASTGAPGQQPLVRSTFEPAGANCEAGGTAVRSGVDANSNGTLDTAEATSTSYICNSGADSLETASLQALVRLDSEAAGTNCPYGGTVARSGLDANGNGTLDMAEVTQTQYICSSGFFYPTRWAVSAPAIESGNVPVGFWVPVGRKVTLYKASASTRLKITASDNLRVGLGVNNSHGYYEVRMNGGMMSPRCYQSSYNGNTTGWTHNYHLPYATVCLTDQLPVGVYEFDVWVHASNGAAYVGANAPQTLLMAEEIPATATYGFSTAGGDGVTASSVYQPAPGRTVVYTKQSASTLLKITLADTLRVGYTQNGGWGTVMVRMNGVNTTCYTGKYDAQGTGGDFHDPFVMTCILPGVGAGRHTFNVWLSSGSGGQAYLGWLRSYPLLLVEEISNQNLTYSNGSLVSGEISGAWAGVAARQVLHTVSTTGKTLRVTYSDTFRSAAGCNGAWGLYQLYVDNQPTGCYNGQYAYNSAGAGQDHHHPVNQVCLVKGLSAGVHSFSIWSTTGCGSNYFGWNRGQNLLLVEEMP